MHAASGIVTGALDTSEFSLSHIVDAEGGQSGSGVWLNRDDLPSDFSFLESATDDLLIGVFTRQFPSGDNGGHLITKDFYDEIVTQMYVDAGSLAAAQLSAMELPENVIVGRQGSDDIIIGSYRKELIIGRGGDDVLIGGFGDDRLEGGNGVDWAVFSDIFPNYSVTVTDPTNPAFKFVHSEGSMVHGTDTTKDIENAVFGFVDANNDGSDDDGNLLFVKLEVDPDDNTKLRDGTEFTPEEESLTVGATQSAR